MRTSGGWRRVISVLLVAVLAVMPLNRAQAIFPIPVIVGVSLVFDSGALAFGYAAATGALAAGATLWAIKFKDAGGADAVTVRLNPKAPRDVPAGWSAASPSSDAPIPPSTATGIPWYWMPSIGQSAPGYATKEGSCAAWVSTLGVDATAPQIISGNCWYHWEPNGGAPGSANAGNVVFSSAAGACPAGYTLASEACTLSDAAVVVKPVNNVAAYEGTGTTFDADSLDPDNAVLPANFIRTSDGKVITVTSGTDTIRLTHNSDNSLSVDQWLARGDGTSDHVRVQASPANVGAGNGGRTVTGAVNERVVGEGSSTGTSSVPGGGVCEGCSLESTQQAVKSAVESTRDALKTDSITADQKALSTQVDASKAAASAHTGAYSTSTQVTSLGLGLSITWPTTSCVDPALTMPGGRGILTTGMCARRDDIQKIMKWLAMILTSFVLFNIGLAAVRKD